MTQKEILACMTVDDPLLRPRYGCLDYERLLQEMKDHIFFTEIAFIPCNYRRNDPETVRLFIENTKYYAVCVHGCDHINNEFASRDYDKLSKLALTALWRMEEHKRRTGLLYDPIMIFPQGRFSSVAVKAIKDHGYFAVFNSTSNATDAADKSFLWQKNEYADMSYHNFPIFLRRYPRDKKKFKLDMAAGRPIIIVEHHAAFRNGYQDVTDVVDWVNDLGNVRWTSLLNIAESYLGYKADSPTLLQQFTPPRGSSTKVWLRRILCEMRDNYIEKNKITAKIYSTVRNRCIP